MKLRTRIGLWITAAGIIVSLAFSLYVFREMTEQAYRHLDGELKATVHDVYKLIASHKKKGKIVFPAAVELLFNSRHYWIKAYHGNQLIYASDLARLADLKLTPGRRKEIASTTIPRSRIDLDQDRRNEVTFRVRTISSPTGYTISAALPMEKLDEEINEVILVLALGLAGVALFLVLISHFLAGRIIKPLQQIIDLAREIDEKNLAGRIPESPSRDELTDLARALNRMLDRLQDSFKRQKRFVASAAHELKTPVTNLRLSTEQALNDPELPEGLRRELIRQHETLTRMGRLLHNLMILSSLEMKRLINCSGFDFGALVDSTIAEFACLFESNQIELSSRLPTGIAYHGDEDQLRRAIVNLIENAVKYNLRPGEIRIELERRGEWLKLTIANRSARELPEEELDNIFEQFYRVEKSRSQDFGGCGLGLTIVREIVVQHEGEIYLENRPEGWITASLKLPLRKWPERKKGNVPGAAA